MLIREAVWEGPAAWRLQQRLGGGGAWEPARRLRRPAALSSVARWATQLVLPRTGPEQLRIAQHHPRAAEDCPASAQGCPRRAAQSQARPAQRQLVELHFSMFPLVSIGFQMALKVFHLFLQVCFLCSAYPGLSVILSGGYAAVSSS